MIAVIEKRLRLGSPKLSIPEVRSLAELAVTMGHDIKDVPSPAAVECMSEEDIRVMLTECPESPHFMHSVLELDREEAKAMAAVLARRWHKMRPSRPARRARIELKPKLAPITEVEEEYIDEATHKVRLPRSASLAPYKGMNKIA